MEQGGGEGTAVSDKPRMLDYFAIKFPINNFVESVSTDGKKIHNYRWPAHEDNTVPKAIICMFHGYGSYVGKFAYYAKLYHDQGYDVIGMDYKGFGYSEGVRGRIESRADFYDDGYQFILKARNFYKDTYGGAEIPIFSAGYSQGGALGLGVARLLKERDQPQFGGQIFVVPNFGLQTDHWTDDYRKELAEKEKSIEETCVFPAKQLRDWSFLISYYQDDLQFKGPHFARTISIVHDIGDEDKSFVSEISYPVHITVADGDNVLDNGAILKFFETVQTPADLKDIEHYDSDHFILSDGWLYEEVNARQCKWLSKVLGGK